MDANYYDGIGLRTINWAATVVALYMIDILSRGSIAWLSILAFT